MDKNLKNALIIIAVLVGLYYFISPYENCMRHNDNYNSDCTWTLENACSKTTRW